MLVEWYKRSRQGYSSTALCMEAKYAQQTLSIMYLQVCVCINMHIHVHYAIATTKLLYTTMAGYILYIDT